MTPVKGEHSKAKHVFSELSGAPKYSCDSTDARSLNMPHLAHAARRT